VDGSLQAVSVLSNTLSATIDETAPFNIGARNSASNFFTGQIDEVAVYDKKLLLAEAQAIRNSGSPNNLKLLSTEPNLVGWWRMGDNMPLCTSPFSTLATTFDGVDEKVAIGDASAFSFENNRPFSISAWFKTIATDGILWAKRLNSGTFRGYILSMTATGEFVFQAINTLTTNHLRVDTTMGDFNDGGWHHIVVTKDSSTAAAGVNIYIDGVSMGLTPVTNNLTGTILNAEDFTIGAGSGATYFPWEGSIDDVAVYNKELTSAEVTTVYNAGCLPDLNAVGPFPNLVGYWFMGEGAVTTLGADTWIDYTDLVWSTGNHSWVILEKPTTGSQLLVSLDRASSRDVLMSWSPQGLYTGGTISVDPTASDQVTIQAFGNWNGGLSVYNSWVHVWHTEDGSKTRIVVTNGTQNPSLFWILDEIDPIPSNWATNPEVVYIYEGAAAMKFKSGNLSQIPVTGNAAKSWDDSSDFDVAVFSLGYDSVPLGFGGFNWISTHKMGEKGNQLNDDTPFPMSPIGVISEETGFRGVHGILVDMYVGHEDRPSGTTYPDSDTEKLWAQFADIILPWTGTSLIPITDGALSQGLIADESVNSNDGTPTNMENDDFVVDTAGGSFSTISSDFDGLEYVVVGDVAPLQFERTDPFSISCWFKSSSTASVGILVSKLDTSAPNAGYEAFMVTGGIFGFQLINTVTTNNLRVDLQQGWNDGAWHHFVATWDGDVADGPAGARIYIDGIGQDLSIFVDNLTGSITTTTPLQFGARDGSNFTGTNSMDDVAIYDKALTPFEVATLWNSTVSPGSGVSNVSMAFGGTDEYIDVGNVAELSFAHDDAFSISIWFKADNANGILISKMNLITGGYLLSPLSGGDFEFRLVGGVSNQVRVITTAGGFLDGAWHHMVATWDGTTTQDASNAFIYIDGVNQTLSTTDDNLTLTLVNVASFNIGSRNNGDFPWEGSIDDAAVYNKALTSGEVATIYNGGSPPDLTSVGPTANLVGYWLMGDGDVYPTIIDNSTNSNDGTMTNMEKTDFKADVPGLIVDNDGFPTDLRIEGPTANLVGYWLMGEDVVTTSASPENFVNGVLTGFGASAVSGATKTFVMTGIDTGAPAPSQPFYHFWTVTGEPDPTGALATGPDAPPFGGPLAEIYVSAQFDVVE
jgi:hypothetical protein